MKTRDHRYPLLLAIAIAVAALSAFTVGVNAGSNKAAVESPANGASHGDTGAAQGASAQSPYSIPF